MKGMIEVTGIWVRNLKEGWPVQANEVLLEVNGSWRLVSKGPPVGGMSCISEIPLTQDEINKKFPVDE